MTDHLDVTEYDFIALGTGLQESLLASAVAQTGSSVLHLDPAAHYGTHWAGLRLDHFLEWAHSLQRKGQSQAAMSELSAPVTANVDSSQQDWVEVAVGSEESAVGPSGIYDSAWVWTAPDVDMGPARSYNIDLAPKVAFCAGPLVQTLLQSGAHNYVEFKLLQGSYIWRDGHMLPVPASKGDVFRSRALSPTDKRVLMRFLKACGDAIEGRGHLKDAFGEQPFLQVLQSEGLSEQLQDIVLYSIALADSDQRAAAEAPAGPPEAHSASGSLVGGRSESEAGAEQQREARQHEAHQVACSREAEGAAEGEAPALMTAEDGWRALQLYMASTGKYAAGGSAFMATVYGVGELSQAFCRVAAVAGATYVLRQPVRALLVDPVTRACIGVRTAAGQTLRCTALAADAASLAGLDCWVASGRSNSPIQPALAGSGSSIARAVCIIDGPLQDGESQLLVVFPPGAVGGNPGAIRVLQVGAATCSTPEGWYLLYLSTPATADTSAAQSLCGAVAALVQLPPEARAPAASAKCTDHEMAGAAAGESKSEQACSAESLAAVPHVRQQRAAEPEGMFHSAERRAGASTLMDVRPKALMVVYYKQDCSALPEAQPLPNVARGCAPDASLGFGSIIKAAATSFKQLYPEAEASFLALDSAGRNEGEESDEEAVEALHAALGPAESTNRDTLAHTHDTYE